MVLMAQSVFRIMQVECPRDVVFNVLNQEHEYSITERITLAPYELTEYVATFYGSLHVSMI